MFKSTMDPRGFGPGTSGAGGMGGMWGSKSNPAKAEADMQLAALKSRLAGATQAQRDGYGRAVTAHSKGDYTSATRIAKAVLVEIGQATPPGATKITHTLRRGSKGAEVSAVQALLKIVVDGDFGGQTEEAVKRFQRVNGLADDGVVGPNTLAALQKVTPGGGNLPQSYSPPSTEYSKVPLRQTQTTSQTQTDPTSQLQLPPVTSDNSGRNRKLFIVGGVVLLAVVAAVFALGDGGAKKPKPVPLTA